MTTLRHPSRWIGRTIVATALLISATGCDGADQSGASDAPTASTTTPSGTTEASPTTISEPATTPPVAPGTAAPVVTPARFDVSMVQQVEVNKQSKGGQANVQVVVGSTARQDALDVAEGCVSHYLQEQQAAFCHVWSTQANYDARDPSGVGDDLTCWTFYVGVPLAGGDPVITETKPYMFDTAGCPDPIA